MAREKWKNPSGTKEYFAWRSMRSRCTNKNNRAWKNYGGRGITVCDPWVESYDAFFEDMGRCPPGHTLERIDNAKGYTPENCKWASWEEQLNNRRNSVKITYDGRTMGLNQWARRLGLKPDTLSKRLQRMGPEKALRAGHLPIKKKPLVHGTMNGYTQHGCRCDECRAENARVARERRAMRKEIEDGEG